MGALSLPFNVTAKHPVEIYVCIKRDDIKMTELNSITWESYKSLFTYATLMNNTTYKYVLALVPKVVTIDTFLARGTLQYMIEREELIRTAPGTKTKIKTC
jgi:hypothetical protein